MHSLHRFLPKFAPVVLAALAAAIVAGAASRRAADESEFARTTIDVGLVVSNAQKSADFYTKAIGFTEIEGFDVPAGMAKDSGLTDGHAVHVRVLVLGKGDTATKIKLLEFKGVPSKKVDNAFIHSSFGLRYLTIWINDTTAAVERCRKQGVKLVAKSPVALPDDLYLTVVNDPDGNIVELVGPKREAQAAQ